MQFVAHLALVSESAAVGLPEVTRVSAALQKQVTRDLGQFWDMQGTVDAFASLEDVPPGYWPVIVKVASVRMRRAFAAMTRGSRWR